MALPEETGEMLKYEADHLIEVGDRDKDGKVSYQNVRCRRFILGVNFKRRSTTSYKLSCYVPLCQSQSQSQRSYVICHTVWGTDTDKCNIVYCEL